MRNHHIRPIFATVLAAISFSAIAYDFKVENLCYNVISEENKMVEVTFEKEWNDNKDYVAGSIEIPSKVESGNTNYTVASIGERAFFACSDLKSVVVSSTVKSIDISAFSDCEALTTITIPNSVTSIGESCFAGCSGLTSIDIPNSVTTIGDYAFASCNGIASVYIPASVVSIGKRLFANCSNLSEILVDSNNPDYCSVSGILYSKDVTKLIECVAGKKGEIKIPDSVNSIGDSAFESCSDITNIDIPELVVSIEDWAFNNCSGLTELKLPNSVTSIGDYAFSGCSGLTSLIIPESITSIGTDVFSLCRGLTSLTISGSATSVGFSAFAQCSSLTSVTIPDAVESIGDYAFYECSALSSVTIGKSVTSIGKNAFQACSDLTKVYCNATVPPQADNNSFSDNALDGTLYVPKGSKSAYELAEVWKNFKTISESETSGISHNHTDGQIIIKASDGMISVFGLPEGQAIDIYDVTGQKVYHGNETVIFGIASGVYIVRVHNKALKIKL